MLTSSTQSLPPPLSPSAKDNNCTGLLRAILQRAAICVQYKQVSMDGRPLEYKGDTPANQCFLAHSTLLIGVKGTIWREEAVTLRNGGVGVDFLMLRLFGKAAVAVKVNIS